MSRSCFRSSDLGCISAEAAYFRRLLLASGSCLSLFLLPLLALQFSVKVYRCGISFVRWLVARGVLVPPPLRFAPLSLCFLRKWATSLRSSPRFVGPCGLWRFLSFWLSCAARCRSGPFASAGAWGRGAGACFGLLSFCGLALHASDREIAAASPSCVASLLALRRSADPLDPCVVPGSMRYRFIA